MGTALADRLRAGSEWVRGSRVADAGVPLLLVLVGAVEMSATNLPDAGRGVALEMLSALILVWRRRWPILVPTVALSILFLMPLIGPALDDVSTPILFLAVGCYTLGRRPPDLWGLAGLAVVLTVTWGIYYFVDARTHDLSDVVFVLTLATPPYVAGRLVLRLDEARQLAERNQELVRGEAVRAERDRIAREMHDVIAHSISAMVVQTAAAQDLVRTDPDRAERALAEVAATGRQALAETGRLLHLIRDEADELALNPAPGLAQVPELVADLRSRGLEVDLRLPEPLPVLPTDLDLSAYRIVQETLTNALRHGADRTAVLAVTTASSTLQIDTSNPTTGRSESGSRLGLLGIEERVSMVGGTLEHGVDPGGRYVVKATLPLPAAVAP